jgi:hypothetical protein
MKIVTWVGLIVLTTIIALAQSAPAKGSRPSFTNAVVAIDFGNVAASQAAAEKAKGYLATLGTKSFIEGSDPCFNARTTRCIRPVVYGVPATWHEAGVLVFTPSADGGAPTILGEAKCPALGVDDRRAVHGALALLFSDDPAEIAKAKKIGCAAVWRN